MKHILIKKIRPFGKKGVGKMIYFSKPEVQSSQLKDNQEVKVTL